MEILKLLFLLAEKILNIKKEEKLFFEVFNIIRYYKKSYVFLHEFWIYGYNFELLDENLFELGIRVIRKT